MRPVRTRTPILLTAALAFGLGGCALSYDFDELTFGEDAGGADGGTDVVDPDTGPSDGGSDATDADRPDADVVDPDVVDPDTDGGGDVVDPDTGRPDTDGGGPDTCVDTGAEVCDGLDNDCDGLVDDDDPDIVFGPDECGACGFVCTNTFSAEGACDVDTCIVERCFDGYEDVDGIYENGCEYRLEPASTLAAGLVGQGLHRVDESTVLVEADLGLALVSVADPNAPVLLDFLATDDEVASVGLSAEGQKLIVGDVGRNIVLVSIVDGQSLRVEARASISRIATALGVSPDVALVGFDDGGVQLYDISSGRFRVTGQNRPWEGDGVAGLHVDVDGGAGWIISESGRVGAFDIVSGISPLELIEPADVPAARLDIRSTWFSPSFDLVPERGELHLLANWDGVRELRVVRLSRDAGAVEATVMDLPVPMSTVLSEDIGGEVVLFQRGEQVFYPPFEDPRAAVWAVAEVPPVAGEAIAAVPNPAGWTVIAPPARLAVIGTGFESERPLNMGATLHDLAWSPTEGDLVVAAGADGVWPMQIIDDRLATGVPVDVGRDVRRVTVDDDLAVAMDDVGRLFLLRREGVGAWSIADNLPFEEGLTEAYVDIRLRDDRLLISSGDRGIRVVPIVRETAPDRWLFGDEVTVLLLDDATDGVQSAAFTDADLLDNHVIALGDGSVWAFDLGSAEPSAVPLILRRRDGVPIETRFTAMSVSDPGKVLVLDPSLGLVGFRFDPLADEPFEIRTGFYVNAVEQLSNEIARGEPVSMASDGEWVSRLSRALGFQLVWNGSPTRFTPVVTVDDGSDQPGFVSTPCPALRHVVADAHIAVVHDCGVDLRRIEHQAAE